MQFVTKNISKDCVHTLVLYQLSYSPLVFGEIGLEPMTYSSHSLCKSFTHYRHKTIEQGTFIKDVLSINQMLCNPLHHHCYKNMGNSFLVIEWEKLSKLHKWCHMRILQSRPTAYKAVALLLS